MTQLIRRHIYNTRVYDSLYVSKWLPWSNPLPLRHRYSCQKETPHPYFIALYSTSMLGIDESYPTPL